jgi:hypothetical protein
MQSPFMLRKLIIIFMAVSLGLTSVSCGSNQETKNQASSSPRSSVTSTNNTGAKLGDGKYNIQQATYNDANGEYTVMLLNTPAGTSPTFRNTNLQMAQLTDEEVKAGEKAYLKIENGQAAMHIPTDFKIAYVRNETVEQTNAQTGQKETVVRQQNNGSSFWSPFAGSVAGSLAGQAIGSMLFRPQYYTPPMYSSGGMFGHGGYGSSYNQAASSYRSRYNQELPAVRNRTTLRTTGRLNNNNSSFGSNSSPTNTYRTDGNRSSGSGFGASRLGQSNNYRSRLNNGSSSGSFGSSSSSRSSSRSSFGSGGRRR